ncbi:MAG: DUF655 domain-containing protein [Promethearchaeota archaeon]
MRRRDQRGKREERKLKDRFEIIGESVVIDFYPQGKSLSHRRSEDYNPLAVVITVKGFQLFDVILVNGLRLTVGDTLLLSPRNKRILRVKQLRYDQLSSLTLESLPLIIKNIVNSSESKYINFINLAHPLTTRMHQLELLPGIGQKRLWSILEARKQGPFSSFGDFTKRTGITDPMSIFTNRILLELETSPKYYLFTKKSL